jgi:hypothetical protein
MSLDLRGVSLADNNILTFQTKKQADRFPLPCLCYVTEAANRFWVFWVVVRKLQSGEFSVMRKDGTFFEVPERQWLGGNVTYLPGN